MKNMPLVQELYAAFSARDEARLREIMDPAIQWNQMRGFPGGGSFVGPEAVFRGVFNRFREEWSQWRVVIDRYAESGDEVLVFGRYEGTHGATGLSMTAEFLHVYHVTAGRIDRFDQYTDTAEIARAMGLILPSPPTNPLP